MKASASHCKTALVAALLVIAASARAADPAAVRATLQNVKRRKLAPVFFLADAAGRKVRLSDYRGKVVLLDFWATECGGCRVEIPYFIEFEQRYRDQGLVVLGVSMDVLYENLKNSEEGWGRVRPFVETRHVNYPILMGDDPAAKLYNLQALPVTYLIDKKGRIAASYAGVVDRNDIETKLKNLLIKR